MENNFADILKATQGRPVEGSATPTGNFGRVSTDTRSISKGDVFVALRGERYDGHDFLNEAIDKGAACLIVCQTAKLSVDQKARASIIAVKDTLWAYGDLAKAVRAASRIPAVAITGSCGKTTVKEILVHLLATKYNVLKNRLTENNLVGVPKTILQLECAHQLMVLEMGTNFPGEIDRLSSIVGPQVGILTRIGCSHLEGLKSQEGVYKEKTSMLPHLDRGGILAVNGEDPTLAGLTSGFHRILRVGFAGKKSAEAAQGSGLDRPARDWTFADQVWLHEKGASFQLNGKDLFETQLVGRHNVLNCLLAIAVASEAFGCDVPSMQKALPLLKPVAGRMNIKILGAVTFLDDTYNANPVSFRAALEALVAFKTRGRKIVVCGDMMELGEQSQELHRKLGAMIAQFGFDGLIAAGGASRHVAEEAVRAGMKSSVVTHVADSVEAGRVCRSVAVEGDLVLVKGSRSTHMEKVFECFTTS